MITSLEFDILIEMRLHKKEHFGFLGALSLVFLSLAVTLWGVSVFLKGWPLDNLDGQFKRSFGVLFGLLGLAYVFMTVHVLKLTYRNMKEKTPPI